MIVDIFSVNKKAHRQDELPTHSSRKFGNLLPSTRTFYQIFEKRQGNFSFDVEFQRRNFFD